MPVDSLDANGRLQTSVSSLQLPIIQRTLTNNTILSYASGSAFYRMLHTAHREWSEMAHAFRMAALPLRCLKSYSTLGARGADHERLGPAISDCQLKKRASERSAGCILSRSLQRDSEDVHAPGVGCVCCEDSRRASSWCARGWFVVAQGLCEQVVRRLPGESVR